MNNTALTVGHVFKKFKKGELYDSLRDLIPALTGKLVSSRRQNKLEDREFWALHDVCFDVKRGEAFGIIGSNGSGKSTILKILSGIMNPTKGTLNVNGKLSALIEISAGFHPDLTGRENILLNGTILGMSRKEIQNRFDEIVEFSGLSDFIDTPVKRYSSGMYARLGFSVAAHVNPDIFIVDEVLSVGDFVFQRKCMERMNQVIRSGATVVFVSHNLRAVSDLCSRSLLLDRGRVVMIGPSDEVIRKYLSTGIERRKQSTNRKIFISDIQVRGANGLQNHFQSGMRAFIDVKVSSLCYAEKLAVVIQVKNNDSIDVFNTSTERINGKSFTLAGGQEVICTFSLELHLVPGNYKVTGYIHRYDIQKEYDHWESAATFSISSEKDIKGIANLYPAVSVGKISKSHPS